MMEGRVSNPGEIRVVLLPVGSRFVLLPNPAVAEIVGFQGIATETTAPEWLLGRIDWRGYTIPVVSFDGIMGGNEPEQNTQRTHIAVLNTLNSNRGLPYIGVLIQGNARLLRVTSDNLVLDAKDDFDSRVILEAVKINNQQAWIPDLDILESMLVP
jgi:chemosensory pili system protein ChpC